jgi:hypothetical protein
MAEDQQIPGVDPELLKNPDFQRVLADALAIQDRFAAEPVYARTGKGYLKSAGVEELKAAKKRLQAGNEPLVVREGD